MSTTLHGVTSQTTIVFISTGMRTSNVVLADITSMMSTVAIFIIFNKLETSGVEILSNFPVVMNRATKLHIFVSKFHTPTFNRVTKFHICLQISHFYHQPCYIISNLSPNFTPLSSTVLYNFYICLQISYFYFQQCYKISRFYLQIMFYKPELKMYMQISNYVSYILQK